MSDLISRQALAKHKFTIEECKGIGEASAYRIGWNDAIDAIIDNETSVEPEIIRCCKCVHWQQDTVRQNSNDASWWNEAVCDRYSDDIWTAWKDADWYCADAERRTDE